MRLAHIVQAVLVSPKSDLHVAQPVTFESMRAARTFATGIVEVELFAANFPEAQPVVPEDFTRTETLDRSVLDFGKFRKPIKMPLVRDILDRLYEASQADYFIYSNIDIAVMLNFYVSVAALLNSGRDALIINGRAISTEFNKPDELPMMYSQLGKEHPGRDCFVWRRHVYKNYRLENACTGVGGVGEIMLLNQLCHAGSFNELTDYHLTFHLGERGASRNDDYHAFNMKQLRKVVDYYSEHNLLPDHPLLGFIER
jgi:hypothetical protein